MLNYHGTAALIVALAAVANPMKAQTDPGGAWGLEVEWPQGPASVILTVQTKDSLSVTWMGPKGELSGHDVTLTEGLLTFVLRVEDQNGRDVELRFEGRATGETLTGRLVTPNGREIRVSGRRRSAGDDMTGDLRSAIWMEFSEP